MAIIKVNKRENPFVQVSRSMAQDRRLTWQARGLMLYLMSKPDGWETKVFNLIKESPGGRDYVYSILKELEKEGYLERGAYRKKDGTFGYNYNVFEERSELTDTASPEAAEPDTAEPDTAEPDTVKPEPYSNTEGEDKEVKKKEVKSSLHPSAMAAFCAFYESRSNTSYLVSGAKDGAALKQLLVKVKKKVEEAGLEPTDAHVLEGFGHLLHSITDDWLLRNLSVSLVNSKFNEIFNQAKNGITTKQTQKGDISGLLDVFGQLDELYR